MDAVFSWCYKSDAVRIWLKTVTSRRLGVRRRAVNRDFYTRKVLTCDRELLKKGPRLPLECDPHPVRRFLSIVAQSVGKHRRIGKVPPGN